MQEQGRSLRHVRTVKARDKLCFRHVSANGCFQKSLNKGLLLGMTRPGLVYYSPVLIMGTGRSIHQPLRLARGSVVHTQTAATTDMNAIYPTNGKAVLPPSKTMKAVPTSPTMTL